MDLIGHLFTVYLLVSGLIVGCFAALYFARFKHDAEVMASIRHVIDFAMHGDAVRAAGAPMPLRPPAVNAESSAASSSDLANSSGGVVINVSHRQGEDGILLKEQRYYVTADVHFSQEMKYVIAQRRLAKKVIMERKPPVGARYRTRVNGVYSLTTKILVAAGLAKADFSWNLTIGMLLMGPDTYAWPTVVEAKIYTQQLHAALEDMKEYITSSANLAENTSITL